jgi:hypothetical protein
VGEKLSAHADGPRASSSTVASAVAAAVGRSHSKRAPQHAQQQGQHQQHQRRRGDTNAGCAGDHAAHHQQRQQASGEFPMLDKAQAEHALKHVQGHLVSWPYDWLSSEMAHGRWNHAVDNLAPLEI